MKKVKRNGNGKSYRNRIICRLVLMISWMCNGLSEWDQRSVKKTRTMINECGLDSSRKQEEILVVVVYVWQ